MVAVSLRLPCLSAPSSLTFPSLIQLPHLQFDVSATPATGGVGEVDGSGLGGDVQTVEESEWDTVSTWGTVQKAVNTHSLPFPPLASLPAYLPFYLIWRIKL